MQERATDREEGRPRSDRRRSAGTLLLITSVLSLHEWVPALFAGV